MNKPYPFDELKKLIEEAVAIDIFLPAEPKFDQVAAALALRLALSKRGKSATVVSVAPMVVDFSHLVGVESVKPRVESGKDLVVSLNYPLEQIEKVSYNDDGGRLNLVVQPKEGAPKIEQNQMSFSYQGNTKSVPMVIGIDSPGRLGSLAAQVDLKEAINLDLLPNNPRFGTLNLIDPGASSFSEMAVALISGLNYAFDQDIANNLFLGMQKVTNNFVADNVTADTFEAAAICLRWGAKRNPGFSPVKKPIFEKNQLPIKGKPFLPEKPPENSLKKPDAGPSPDWLEPKIFKSSNV